MPWFEIVEVSRMSRTFLVEADDLTQAGEEYGVSGIEVDTTDGDCLQDECEESEITPEEIEERWGFTPEELRAKRRESEETDA